MPTELYISSVESPEVTHVSSLGSAYRSHRGQGHTADGSIAVAAFLSQPTNVSAADAAVLPEGDSLLKCSNVQRSF